MQEYNYLINQNVLDKDYKIEFSVPGFDKKQFSVEIENDILRVSNTSEDEVSDKYYKRQFNYSNFSKTFITLSS